MEEPTAYHRRRRTQPPTTTASSRSPSSSSMAHNDASWDWDWDENGSESEDSAPSLAAKAIRASSAAQRASSLSSAYSQSSFSKPNDVSLSSFSPRKTQNPAPQQYTSMKDLSESKHGFWSVLARKAKSMVEDDDVPENATASKGAQNHRPDRVLGSQGSNPSRPTQTHRKLDGAVLHKGLGAIASSLNYIGGTIGNALEEGITLVENRTADIMQETRRLNIRKKGDTPDLHKQVDASSPRQKFTLQHQMQPPVQSDLEIQLKASRDVAMAMAAKTKLLLRELKTVKADFAFAKERCAQLEEENRILRQSVEKGNNPEDDDLIRLQLETLLAEKARLAHENTVYARENRFLREIVEYHQLTMQDVVYVNENSEEVSEVYPTKLPSSAAMPPLSYSSSSDFKHGQVT